MNDEERARAAEAVVSDFVRGVGAEEFQPSSVQTDMCIRPELVLMAGLAVGERRTAFDERQQRLFERLQRKFHEERGDETENLSLFRLSPRLLPNERQINAVSSLLQQKRDFLNAQAESAAQELLQGLGSEGIPPRGPPTKSKKSVKKKPKKAVRLSDVSKDGSRRATEPLRRTGHIVLEDKTTATPTRTQRPAETKESSPSTGYSVTHESVSGTADRATHLDNASSSCERMLRTAATISNRSKRTEPRTDGSPEQNGTDALPKRAVAAEDDSTKSQNAHIRASDIASASVSALYRHSDLRSSQQNVGARDGQDQNNVWIEKRSKCAQEERPRSERDCLSSHRSVSPSVASSNRNRNDGGTSQLTDTVNGDVGTQRHLRERVASLEREIERKDREIAMLKSSHEQTMRAEREANEERLQALQLRLYISETRLKTFQDALDQHVEAVRNNVSRNYDVSRNSDGKTDESPSPLFARVPRNRSGATLISDVNSDR